MFTKRVPLDVRFRNFVMAGAPEQCWPWKGKPNSSGYGSIRMPGRVGKMILAHRLAYEFYYQQPVPRNLCVLHSCDNPICVNPHHLFLGTNADNVADRENKGRGNSRGFPGERCGHAKLKNADVINIRRDSRSHYKIAIDYGVARSTVTNIKLRRTWRHL